MTRRDVAAIALLALTSISCAATDDTAVGVAGGALDDVPFDDPVEPAVVPAAVPAPGPFDGCGLPFARATDERCHRDRDGDGSVELLDCDDRDPLRRPGTVEVGCDGVDQDCNGFDDCDADSDNWLSVWDCDDHDPSVTADCAARSARSP